MAILFEIMRSIEDSVRSKLITCDCEIILFLYYNEACAAGDMFEASRHSSTSFYGTLKRLAATGVIVAETNPRDKRSNIYSLSPAARDRIDSCLGSIAFLMGGDALLDTEGMHHAERLEPETQGSLYDP